MNRSAIALLIAFSGLGCQAQSDLSLFIHEERSGVLVSCWHPIEPDETWYGKMAGPFMRLDPSLGEIESITIHLRDNAGAIAGYAEATRLENPSESLGLAEDEWALVTTSPFYSEDEGPLAYCRVCTLARIAAGFDQPSLMEIRVVVERRDPSGELFTTEATLQDIELVCLS